MCATHYETWLREQRGNPTCCVIGCSAPVRCKQLCNSHYLQARRGREFRPRRVDESLEIRLLNRCAVNLDTGCWEWLSSRHKDGTGLIAYHGRKLTAHRAAYKTWVGPIPDGQSVHHKCGNHQCINPDHLVLASRLDNTLEMHERHGLRAEVARLRALVIELGGNPDA